MIEERNKRFEGLYGDKLQAFIDTPHVVIGVGATGGQIVRTLGQLGVKYLTLWDDDTIEEVNIGPQGFKLEDIGRHKVDARSDEFHSLSPDSVIRTLHSRFVRYSDHPEGAIWWILVDSLDDREFIVQAAMEHTPKQIIDPRIGGTVYEVYNVLGKGLERYLETVQFARDNPVEESCTTRTTPHSAAIAGAIAINFGLQSHVPFCVKGNLLSYTQETIW